MRNRARFRTLGTVFSSVFVGGLIIYAMSVRGSVLCSLQTHIQSTASDSRLASDMPSPLCGHLDDGKVHIPSDWTSFAPPSKGQSFVDPVFGCRVKRLTDSSAEETSADGTHLSFSHTYSTMSPINASDTMLLINSDNGALRVIDTDGKVLVPSHKMPAMNNGHAVWDAFDGNSFYYTLGKILYKGTLKNNSVKSTPVRAFKEYSGIVSPDHSDLSQDGDHIALVGQNSNNTMDVFVWSFKRQVKTSIYTTACKINQWDVTQTPQPGCIHKVLLTPNNLLLVAFAKDGTDLEQGARLWDGSRLTHLQDRTNHADTGFDLNGNAVFIESGNSAYTSGFINPCRSGWGLDVRRLSDVSLADCLLDHQPSWHVSYRGGPSQPWAALSFCDKRNPGPELFEDSRGFQEPSKGNWDLYEDEILLARIDGKAIYRLAHTRSRSAENYDAEPHAAISRDGRYIIFSSNMAYPKGCLKGMHSANECTDVYLIKVH